MPTSTQLFGNTCSMLVRGTAPVSWFGAFQRANPPANLRDAAWMWIANDLAVYEEDARLAAPAVAGVRVSLPSDRSFESYGEAFAHVTGARLPDATSLYWNQGMLDVLFEYPIRSDRSRFSIEPSLAAEQMLAAAARTTSSFSGASR